MTDYIDENGGVKNEPQDYNCLATGHMCPVHANELIDNDCFFYSLAKTNGGGSNVKQKADNHCEIMDLFSGIESNYKQLSDLM